MPLARVGEFEELFNARGSYWLTIIGRLKPGVTRLAAQVEMDAKKAAGYFSATKPGSNELARPKGRKLDE